jgi:hypothetical protein
MHADCVEISWADKRNYKRGEEGMESICSKYNFLSF